MERRKNNWGTLVYTLKAGTRRNPLFRSSPNLLASSRTNLFDDDDGSDDYGFITKQAPMIPPPPVPMIPLEFQDEYQKRLKEHRNKVYWESIKRQLTDYYGGSSSYSHQQPTTQRMSEWRGSSGMLNNLAMDTTSVAAKPNSTNKSQKNKQNSVTQSVPVQSSFGLDDDWLSGRKRKDSGSTSELLDQVCEVQDCCERFEDFCDEEDFRNDRILPLCVKCLVRYYNSRPTKTGISAMSRVSSTLV